MIVEELESGNDKVLQDLKDPKLIFGINNYLIESIQSGFKDYENKYLDIFNKFLNVSNF